MLQSCPTLCNPIRLPHPWESPGKNTGVGCHFLLQCMKVKSESEVTQSCPTLCDPMDCSLPGSSIHGIFQARVLEWGAIAFSDIYIYIYQYLRYADETTLKPESEELKSLLIKVKESEKVALKLNIQKIKIMATGPITSWQIDGETVETVADFILGGSKITTDGDCSHKIKRCLLLGRKVVTNPNSVLKGRDIILPTKVCLVKAMVFPVVMYGCESWTIKKAER